MAFDARVERAARAIAKKNNVEPELVLAIVEIECAGQPFEKDGVTPRFLFERHKFHEFLRKHEPSELDVAVQQGLAIPRWSRTTQYKDLGSSAGRMRVLNAAAAISMEGAYWSCSWGLGQIMGFHAKALGYGTATQMFSDLRAGGIHAQIECMWRFMKSKGIIPPLKEKNWPKVALLYNGAGYAANDYDTRLASSYAKWKAKDVGVDPDEDEDIPLGRTPVQNAEAPSVWRTPEGLATIASGGTGVVAAIKPESKDGRGPMDYALAIVVVIAICVAAYYFIRRLRRTPE